MRLPAVCDSCGTIFASSFEVANARETGFYGCSSGPCPKCGGMGHIPDGLYNIIDNTIELLSGPKRTVSELHRLAALLQKEREEGSSAEQVVKKIETEVPELSSLKDILPKTRTELYAFITIILAVITLLISQLDKDTSPKIEVNQVFNIINQQNTQVNVTPSQENQTTEKEIKAKKTGRNDPCICGSGKKYKKCCLK